MSRVIQERGSAVAALLALTMACWWPGDASGQPVPSAGGPTSTMPSEGFWPTRRMVELVLMKAVEGAAKHYQLDDQQTAAVKEEILTQIPALLNRHRSVLQPMLSEILEMQLAEERPTAEQVARMARAVEPALGDLRKTVKQMHDKVRPVLNPEQRIKLDQDMVKVWGGLAMVDTQVARWKRGEFKPSDWPLGPRRDNRRGSASRPSRQPSGPVSPTDARDGSPPADSARAEPGMPPPGPNRFTRPSRRPTPSVDAGDGRREVQLDQWQAYVERFIRQHDLDEGQATQAMAILKDIRQQASEYTNQYKGDIDRIERELADADPDRRARLNAELAEIRAPLKELFDEMRQRLDGVLRSDQQRPSQR